MHESTSSNDRSTTTGLLALNQMLAQAPLTPAQWIAVSHQVSKVVKSGLKPSSIPLREALLPHFDSIPDVDGYRKDFELALRYVQEYLDSRPSDGDDQPENDEPNPEVLKVRSLLTGGRMVMICGQSKAAAKQRLEEAFGLREVLWESISFNESKYDFIPLIRSEGVKIVVLAIKHCRTLTKELKPICDRLGIPFLMLTGGYNPQQVAHRILASCGDRLADSKEKEYRYA